MSHSRRVFLGRAATMAAAAALVPGVVEAVSSAPKKKRVYAIPPKGVVLFQGDSITDAGREKSRELPNNGSSLGGGYAFLAATALLDHFAALEPVVYNRGISGNKVYQLAARWQKDCLELKPDVLSILIGINDYWHMRNGQYDGTLEKYEADYRALLDQTRQALPGVRLVVCEPFALPGTTAVDESWVEPVGGYREVALKLSREFGAVWVPFQRFFDEAILHAPASWWSADGVHPSLAGSHLMAAAWLRTVFGI
ncbi:MAG TPA: SGNH/GDSL hydrolase family protein [Prolixibacteraceae bacterium]|nr:SGNH/GDSL hydrolase family protein [Prolixibacteraceae bacterium]